MAPNFIQDFYKGQSDFAETSRLLILQEDENLFLKLDFTDDDAFLDPFLFFYFKQKFLHLNQTQKVGITLEQILFGYIKKKKLSKEHFFKAFSNTSGLVYLPKVGYFNLAVKNQEVVISYTKESGEFNIFFNDKKLDHKFIPVKLIKKSNIELYQFNDPLFDGLYSNWLDKENIRLAANDLPVYKLSPVSLYEQNHAKIEYAFHVLKNSQLNYCQLLNTCTKGIYSFKQEGIWSFAAKAAHGASFLSGSPTDSVIFFICELAHQGGHSIFDSILHKPERIFLESPDTPMPILSGDTADDRTLADATHGLYTTAKVVEVLDYLYSVQDKLKLTKELKHELVGRLADNYYRHRTGLQKVDQKKAYTSKGLNIYSALDNYLTRIYKKYDNIPSRYRYGQGDFVFNYDEFKLAHPLV